MIGFGESNEEFGKLSPGLVSFEEQIICDDDDSRLNSLIIRLKTETGIKLRIQFDDYLMYMSRNESFTCGDEYEKHKGMWLVTFEKSRFLDMSNYVISDVNIFNSPGIRTHSLIIVYHFWQVDIKGQRRTFRAFFRFLPDFLEELHGRAPCRASGVWFGSRHSARYRFCPKCNCGCSGIVIPFAHWGCPPIR